MKIVRSDEFVAYGAKVLVRGVRATLAEDGVANATVSPPPRWAINASGGYAPGESIRVEMIEGIGGRDLHAIARGPIMDPNQLYLPAGKLSMSDYRQREARIRSGEPA